MKILLFIVIGLLVLLFWNKLFAYVIVIFFICPFLCDINPDETYSWLSGIWHGLFFIPNYIRSLVDSSVLFKAADYGTGYNFFWWFFTIQSTLSLFYGEAKRSQC